MIPRPARSRAAARLSAWAAALALAAGPALGQSNDEIQTGIQLNFSTPGARSLALGGAFLGAADDATAAYTNPAGLTQLVEPEASFEARAWRFESRFADRGHVPETGLTGIGIDTIDGLEEGSLADETAGLSFLSYVHTAGRWAFAAYRHQLADFRASLEMHGPFVGGRNTRDRIFPARSELALEIANYGLSAAYRLRDDLSLGLGLSYFDFELASQTDRYLRAERTGDPLVDVLTGNFYGPADFRPENVTNTQTQDGDDSAFGLAAGWLWKIDGRWSVGGVFRQGPELDFRATFTDGPASGRPGQVDPTLGGDGIYHVPDVWGLGVAWRPSDSMLLTFDWDRVRYSELADRAVNLLRAAQSDPGRFVMDDADELHLGFEYQGLAAKLPWSVRLGAWHDPDHRLRYEGPAENLRARFRAGEDELHWAAGVGLVVARFQLDLAADVSEQVTTLSLSGVARF